MDFLRCVLQLVVCGFIDAHEERAKEAHTVSARAALVLILRLAFDLTDSDKSFLAVLFSQSLFSCTHSVDLPVIWY